MPQHGDISFSFSPRECPEASCNGALKHRANASGEFYQCQKCQKIWAVITEARKKYLREQ